MNAFVPAKYSLLLLLLTALVYASTASSQVYQITDLGVLPGQSDSSAVAINQSGQIAGNSGNHAFLYSNGTLTDLGFVPGAVQTTALAINNKGQIVGAYATAAYGNYPAYRKGFLWANGVISDVFSSQAIIDSRYAAVGVRAVGINDNGQVLLNVYYSQFGNFAVQDALLWQGTDAAPTSIGTQAYAINNTPQVTLVNRPYYAYGAIWSSGGTTVLPQLFAPDGGYGPTPYGISDTGQVVGEALVSSGAHAFQWSAGAITDLGTLGGANSTARAVNKGGLIVGDSEFVPNSSNRHAFVYSAGQMLDLNSRLVNPQPWQLQSAAGINDLGQIVCTGAIGDSTHAFLLTPQPSGTIYPTHGGNAGKVTLLIVSPGFVPGAIQLTGAGGTLITGSAISVPTFLAAAVQVTFDLTGVQPGAYSVVLSQASSQPITLSNTFTVDQGGGPDIHISVAGFPQLRAGLLETYDIVVQNRGDEDSGKIRVWVSFPDYLQWQPAGMQPSSSGNMNGNTYLAFDVTPSLGSNIPIPFLLTAPFNSDLVHRPFQIQAWEVSR